MRDNEHYLDYDPKLNYTAQLSPTISAAISQAPATVDPALTLLSDKPSSVVLKQISDTLTTCQTLIDGLSNEMSGDVANGISFEEYIGLRKTDLNKAQSYVSAHQESITGAASIDLLPSLLDTKDELTNIQSLFIQRFYNNEMPANLEIKIKKEKTEASGLIDNYLSGKDVPLDQTRMDNNFRDIISDRIDTISQFVDNCKSVLDGTLEQDTRGTVPLLVSSLAAAYPYLPQIQELNQSNFTAYKDQHQDDAAKMSRLTPPTSRISILSQFDSLQAQVMKYKDVTDFLANQSTNSSFSAILADNAANGLSQIHTDLNNVFSDSYRYTYLQSMQNDALIQSANGKRNARQFNKLITDMQRHYDPTSPNQDLQINRIVSLQK